MDITNVLGSGTLKGTLDFLNKAGDFDGSDFKGLGYYEKTLDSLVATFAKEFNKANLPYDENGNRTNLKDKDGNVIVPKDKDGKPIYEQTDARGILSRQ